MILMSELEKRKGKVKVTPKPVEVTPPQEHTITIDTEKLESLISDLIIAMSARPEEKIISQGITQFQLERIVQSLPKEREVKPFEARIMRDGRGVMTGAKFYPVEDGDTK